MPLRMVNGRYLADEGEQVTRISQRMTLVGCEEWGCDWYFAGAEGVDADGHIYRHPVGAHCGNVRECPDPNCPCTARCAQTSDPNLLRRFPYIADAGVGFLVGLHYAPLKDPAAGLSYFVNTGAGERQTVGDEVVQRLYGGTESLRHIRERGI